MIGRSLFPRLCLGFCVLLIASDATGAQDVDFTPQPGETIAEYRARTGALPGSTTGTMDATGTPTAGATSAAAVDPKKAASAKASALTDTVESKIREKTTAGPSPDGFADRVNDSISDFLPLLEFAVNSVSTSNDRRSVTAKLNPLKVGRYGAIAISTTATDPEISTALLEQVVESSREAQKEALRKDVGDYGDLTWSLSYGFQREARGDFWNRKFKYFGRTPELYAKVIEDLVEAIVEPAFAASQDARDAKQTAFDNVEEKLAQQFSSDDGDGAARELPSVDAGDCDQTKLPQEIQNLTFCMLDRAVDQGALELDLEGFYSTLEQHARADAELWQALNTNSLSAPIDSADPSVVELDDLQTMVDNQPQLVLSAALRDADDRVGASSQSYTLKYELGTRNVNRVFKEYRWLKAEEPDLTEFERRRQAFHNVMTRENYRSQNRFSLAVTYTERDDQTVEHSYQQTVTDAETMVDTQVDRMASLTAPGQSEWCGKLFWSRYRTAADEAKKNAMGSISLEYMDVDGGSPTAPDAATRQSRFIARFTYALPVQNGTSIPVTLTYANKGEFLGEQNEVLSANLGLSWKSLSSREK